MSYPDSDHFVYVDGALRADGVELSAVAEQVGTPAYVYSAASIDAAYASVDAALSEIPHLVAYAVKANSNLSILRRLAAAGCGADIVSGGELLRALQAGFTADRIVFSGVGKTDDELRLALEHGVRSIHAENEGEIEVLAAIAAELGTTAPISLRVNPNVDAGTHPYIATGLHESKFGLELDVARRILPGIVADPHLELEGIACHIGSLVLSPEPIGEAVRLVTEFACECKRAGAPIRTVDAGGGWPILYGDEQRSAESHAVFGRAVIDGVRRGGGDTLSPTLIIEPGRSIVGDSGVLLTRVLYVKEQAGKRFIIVDGAMTELIRPSLYGAYHGMMPVTEPGEGVALAAADVVGPVCESGDFLAKDRPMPPVKRGDLIAVRGAGAYGSVMASNYNSRPFAPEVLVLDGEAQVIRARQRVEDIWGRDV